MRVHIERTVGGALTIAGIYIVALAAMAWAAVGQDAGFGWLTGVAVMGAVAFPLVGGALVFRRRRRTLGGPRKAVAYAAGTSVVLGMATGLVAVVVLLVTAEGPL